MFICDRCVENDHPNCQGDDDDGNHCTCEVCEESDTRAAAAAEQEEDT